MRAIGALGSLVLALSLVFEARAEQGASETPALEAPKTVAPGDVVELVDGSVYRGQISETVPNSHVTILTLTGEVRRLEWDKLRYSGTAEAWLERKGGDKEGAAARPEAEEPAPAHGTRARPGHAPAGDEARLSGPASTPAKDKARLVFKERGGHTLYVRRLVSGQYGATTRYDELCTAPCETSIEPGSHVLAVTRPLASAPVSAGPLEIAPGVSEVRASISDSRPGRVVGVVLMVAGPLVGLSLVTYGLVKHEQNCSAGYCVPETAPDAGLIIGGIALTLGGVGGGLALVLQRDSAEIEVKRVARGLRRTAGGWPTTVGFRTAF